MPAFGDIWDCASHSDHSSRCLVKDSINSIMVLMHIYEEQQIESSLLMMSLKWCFTESRLTGV